VERGALTPLLDLLDDGRGCQNTRMTPNKAAVERYMEAYRRHDHAAILACLADDIEWEVPGAFQIRGKEAFDQHIESDCFIGPPEITVARLTEENDVVVAEGTVRTRQTDGIVLNLAYCDIFEMRGGLIRKLVSYLVQVK
jgi:ketosteroid isomerase-like protein